MLPLAPLKIEASDPAAALRLRATEGPTPERLTWSRRPVAVTMTAADARDFNLTVLRIERRRDVIASRRRWQFTLRDEAIVSEAV